jgi:uncharacterized protein (TIGR01777 family)
MRIAMTGSGGLVGRALSQALAGDSHDVVRLVRRPARRPDERAWVDHASGEVPEGVLDDVDAVVHLAGESIAQPWTQRSRRLIRGSRVEGTAALARALARQGRGTLVMASAVGYYGDRGSEQLDETSTPGEGFLAEVCRAWEAAAEPARAAGIRVVALRLGIVLSREGGALPGMARPFRFGLGGRLGSGEQYVSWIHRDDAVAAFRWALTSDVEGAVNCVAPQPATNAELTAALAAALRRPAFFAVPAFVVRWLFDQMGRELLLASTRAMPRRLLEARFAFSAPDLAEAVARELVRV